MKDVYMNIPATEVKVGDMIDLEGDTYADPARDHPWMEDEYAIVAEVDYETSECVAIGFESFDLVGFPIHHPLRKVV